MNLRDQLLAAAELLSLDDFGTIKVTEFVWKTLFGFVNAAYDGGRQTLYITSNEPPEELAETLTTPDRPNGGERIVRRLVQLCDVVQV